MSKNKIIPKQGDLIWIDAEPHAGKEYGGHDPAKNNNRRPMLVISSDIYNERTGFVSVFPITHHVPSRFPMKKKIHVDNIDGYIVFAGLLGYDFEARHGKIVGQVDAFIKREALNYIEGIFGFIV